MAGEYLQRLMEMFDDNLFCVGSWGLHERMERRKAQNLLTVLFLLHRW